jgi:biopolymer transport protein ExbD
MAFRPSRIKKHSTDPGKAKLNLTSMMDMFTIILVFLLKTYSIEGQLIQPSEYLTLPQSTVRTPPEVALDLIISREWIMVNDEPVEELTNVVQQQGLIINRLRNKLSTFAKEAKRMEELYGTKFSGKVTIQGDQHLPYKVLVKIMATCGKAEYPNMRLVVYQKEG